MIEAVLSVRCGSPDHCGDIIGGGDCGKSGSAAPLREGGTPNATGPTAGLPAWARSPDRPGPDRRSPPVLAGLRPRRPRICSARDSRPRRPRTEVSRSVALGLEIFGRAVVGRPEPRAAKRFTAMVPPTDDRSRRIHGQHPRELRGFRQRPEDDREQRLNEVIAAYLEDLEAGRSPDRPATAGAASRPGRRPGCLLRESRPPRPAHRPVPRPEGPYGDSTRLRSIGRGRI